MVSFSDFLAPKLARKWWHKKFCHERTNFINYHFSDPEWQKYDINAISISFWGIFDFSKAIYDRQVR